MFAPAFVSPGRQPDWRRPAFSLLLVLAALAAGCRSLNIGEAVTATDLTGGWYDDGVVDGRNRLLPSVSFRLEKSTNEEIGPLALNVLFKRLVSGEEQEWEDVYLQRVEFTEGNRTRLLTVRPANGYTADPPQSRAEMLQHSEFVDVRAIILARQGSTWIELGRLDLPRTLITPQ